MASDIADMVMGRHLRTHGASQTTGLTFNSNVLTGRLQVLRSLPASELHAAPAGQRSPGALCSGHSLLCSRLCSLVATMPGCREACPWVVQLHGHVSSAEHSVCAVSRLDLP